MTLCDRPRFRVGQFVRFRDSPAMRERPGLLVLVERAGRRAPQ